MKKFALTVLLCAAASSAFAASNALRVELTDGTTSTFVLSEKPKVTFSGSQMNIATADASASFERADVKAMNFTDASGIADVKGDSDFLYKYDGETFEAPGLEISVYSIDGKLSAGGLDSVSLSDLPSGVYAVKAGDRTIKILK